MKPNPITHQTYYSHMLRIDQLMGAKPDTVDMEELELLTELVETYEDQYYPMGIFLERFHCFMKL